MIRSLFRRDRSAGWERVVIVSGLPRSGTSMMMKMLEAGGIAAVTDRIRAADDDNPKGYYEFERAKALDKGDAAWLPEAKGKAVKVISALLKYLPAEYDYRVLFVRRSMEEILASQKKMLANRGEPTDQVPDAKMSELFQKHLAEVEAWLAQQRNFSVLYVDYNAIMADPRPGAEAINAFLDGGLDVEAMVQIVDPDLYRQRHPRAGG